MSKLLQIAVEGNTGSSGTIAEAIGEHAIHQGWESYIAYSRFPRPSNSNTIRIGSYLDVLIHVLETRLFDSHGLGSKKATKQLIKQIQIIRPDIIHLHHLHGYYINIKILFDYLSKTKIPVVWTFHDCWSLTGHCCHFDFIGCNKWKSECNHCPQLKEYPASLFFDRSNKNYHLKKMLFTSVNKMVIVSVSYWMNNIVSQSFLKDIDRQVIYNGIDTTIFKPNLNSKYIKSKYGLEGSFLILGVASPWGKRKGLEDFKELSKHLNVDEKIVLIGLSSVQIKSLPKGIIGISKTEDKQFLIDLYSAADVFLNLSVEETFGLTTAEAMACGTPSIVYYSTACPEVLDTSTGIIVIKRDILGLVNAISVIKKNGKKYYSDKCRERVITHFNKRDKFKEYICLYNKLMQTKY